MRAADAQAFEVERQDARQRRLRFELERQELAANIVRQAAQRVTEIISARYVEDRTRIVDGKPEQFCVGFRTQALRDAAILMRELNRLALAAVIDAVAEHEHKLKDAEEGAPVRTVIAGTFSISEQMYDRSAPPELPTAAVPVGLGEDPEGMESGWEPSGGNTSQTYLKFQNAVLQRALGHLPESAT